MAAKAGKVITATLIRGRIYFYKNTPYERGVPKIVDESLAAELENLADTSYDSDGEEFDKPLFDVDWEADPPIEKEENVRPLRTRRRRRVNTDEEDEPKIVPRRKRKAS